MYDKTITRFGFCDIQNNQGLGKDYLDLDYSGYHNNLSNCFYLGVVEKIAMFPCFSELLKAHSFNIRIIKFMRRFKAGNLRFLELNSSKFLKETRTKCQMCSSVRANSLKRVV